jgi:hypothetical protein
MNVADDKNDAAAFSTSDIVIQKEDDAKILLQKRAKGARCTRTVTDTTDFITHHRDFNIVRSDDRRR